MLNDDRKPRQAHPHKAPRLIDFIGRDGTVPIKVLLDVGLVQLIRGRVDLGGDGCLLRPGNADFAAALAEVRVCHFRTEVRESRPLARFKGKPIDRGKKVTGYRLIQRIGLSSSRRIGVMLSNPVDTILSFGGSPADSAGSVGELSVERPLAVDMTGGPPIGETTVDVDMVLLEGRGSAKVSAAEPSDATTPPPGRPAKPTKTKKPSKPPAPISGSECDILIHAERDAKGTVRLLRVSGTTVRFHLSRRLVLPVAEAANQWAVGPNRVAIDLGTAWVQLRRGFAPRVSTPLDCYGATVEIARRGILAQLGTVTLGGTYERPQVIFDDIRLVKP